VVEVHFLQGDLVKECFSRLYTNILNGYSYVDSSHCFLSSYYDAGVFGIYSTVEHGKLSEILSVMCSELLRVSNDIGEEELTRAKNQLKSTIFFNLESRSIIVDDLARQVLMYGRVHPADEICARIDSLTAEDLKNVVKDCLRSKPTLVVYGQQIPELPSAEFVGKFLREHSSS